MTLGEINKKVMDAINKRAGKLLVDESNFDKVVKAHLDLLLVATSQKVSNKPFVWEKLEKMGAVEFLVLLASNNITFTGRS